MLILDEHYNMEDIMWIISDRKYQLLTVAILITSLTVACSSNKGAGGGVPSDPVISVIDFQVEDMNLTQARAVTDRVFFYLSRHKGLKVIEREDAQKIFGETGFRLSGNCETDDCISQVGHVLGAGYMVAGKVSKAGNFYHLELRLINVNTTSMITHSFCDVRGMETLLTSGSENTVNDLLAEINRN
jgi:TolB-like protein